MVNVAIIGGGLAGTACAFALKRAGAVPVIYESAKVLASGASGNDLGMYNPRFKAERNAQSAFYTSAFVLAIHTFKQFKNIDWARCGALHLITDEKKKKRYPLTLKNWGWDFDHMQIVDAVRASEICGVELQHDALWLPDAGHVSPRKLCAAYADGVEIKYTQNIAALSDIKADAIILANGTGVKAFEETKNLPINPVRGQITEVNATRASKNLQCNIHYGGYIGRPVNGIHALGASFQPWLDHTKILLEDNKDNIAKLGEAVSALAGEYEVVGHRAAVRSSSKDHFPVVGQVGDNLYVSAAHGSHGIISTIKAAELLTDMILNRPRCLPAETIKALSPGRFV